jgi:hypothetical protein
VEHFSGSLDVDAQIVYTVYFYAVEELFDAVMLDVKEIISQTAEAEVDWEKPKEDMFMEQDMVQTCLLGTDREEVIDMKNIMSYSHVG